MAYLIDGYNLLFTIGLAHRRTPPRDFERARNTLIARLAQLLGPAAGETTVVFDALHGSQRGHQEEVRDGVTVVFALRRLADDLIEELIGQDSAPRGLTVVSDDRRVQQAARRRHCPVLGCLDFVERLGRPAAPPPEEAPAKPSGVSRAEAQHWLREFADLAGDPKVRAELNPGLPEDEP